MEKLASNLYQLEKAVFAVVGPGGTTNFGIVRGDAGTALLVDADIRRIDEIEDALKKTGCRKVGYLFNTHENFDHSSANDYFEKNGTVVIASEGCWKALKEDGEAKFAEMASGETELWKRFSDMKMGLPRVSFSQTAHLYLSGVTNRFVFYAYNGQSHSRGDAVAFLDEKKILFAGDLLYTEVHPVVYYGHIPNWLKSINLLSGQDFDCVVPGHGPIVEGRAACLEAFLKFRNYLEDFHQQLSDASAGRKSAEELHAHMTSGNYASLGKTWMLQRNIDFFLKQVK